MSFQLGAMQGTGLGQAIPAERLPNARERLMSIREQLESCLGRAMVIQGAIRGDEPVPSGTGAAPAPGPYPINMELDIVQEQVKALASRLAEISERI